MKDLIKPIERHWIKSPGSLNRDGGVCKSSDVDEVEENLRECVKALIDIGLYGALKYEHDWKKIQYTIEKVTGQKWEDIRDED